MAEKKVKVGTSFDMPGYENADYNTKVDSLGSKAKQDFTTNRKEAEHGTASVFDKGSSVPDESLYEDAKANEAKGQGRYGMFNDKDYATTLRLARNVDKYNSMPVQHMMSIGTRNTGGVKDLGTGFEKPRLETMESRAINQTLGLDTNQKQLAQQLQFAIDSKDLELLKQVLTQQLGLQVTDLQVKNIMDQMVKQTEISQLTQKELKIFSDKWTRAFGEETAAALYNMVQENEAWSSYLGEITTGTVPPGKEDLFATDFVQSWLEKTNPQDAKQLINEYNAARNELNKFNIKASVADKASARVYNNWFANMGALWNTFKEQTKGE